MKKLASSIRAISACIVITSVLVTAGILYGSPRKPDTVATRGTLAARRPNIVFILADDLDALTSP